MSDIIPIIGIDIGGTMSKISFAVKKNGNLPKDLNIISKLTITTYQEFDIYFFTLPSKDVDTLVEKIKILGIQNELKKIHITGGGAFKYCDLITQSLGLEVEKISEFESLGLGFDFLDHLSPNSSFFTQKSNEDIFIEKTQSIYPFLLVNIGSGVSMLKFTNSQQIERTGGTSLGGGLFLGLCNVLMGINDYDQLLEMSHLGTNTNDLMLQEVVTRPLERKLSEPNLNQNEPIQQVTHSQSLNIQAISISSCLYQGDLSPSYQNHEESIAVSLGKLFSHNETPRNEDLVKSLLHLTAYNISQVAYQYSRLTNIQNIFFSGYFIRGHRDTVKCITNAFQYFSSTEGEQKFAYFVKHDGFIGSLGAMQVAYREYQQKE